MLSKIVPVPDVVTCVGMPIDPVVLVSDPTIAEICSLATDAAEEARTFDAVSVGIKRSVDEGPATLNGRPQVDVVDWAWAGVGVESPRMERDSSVALRRRVGFWDLLLRIVRRFVEFSEEDG